MSARDSLSAGQSGESMSVHRLMSPAHWDTRSVGTPEALYQGDRHYIDRMADDIREPGAGSLGAVELSKHGVIDDGHHRTYASYLANEWTVPVRQAEKEAGE